MKNKVSFDFDGTLDKADVQLYTKELIQEGFDVWICTSRLEPSKAPTIDWNDDLFNVAKKCNIKNENIIFCNYENKSEHLKDKGFIIHLDNDITELTFIKIDTDIAPILYTTKNKSWLEQCDIILKSL